MINIFDAAWLTSLLGGGRKHGLDRSIAVASAAHLLDQAGRGMPASMGNRQ